MIGIYIISNQVNQKQYVGQSIHIEARWKQHIYIALNMPNEQTKLYNAIRKYGINNFTFELLEECPVELLDEREKYYISYYNTYVNGYNMTNGGQGEDRWMFDPCLIHQLWDEGYSTAEIVEIVGCSDSTVLNNLTDYPTYSTTESRSRGMKKHIQKYGLTHNIPYTTTQFWKEYFDKSIPVYQYSLEGQFIASYPSAAAAARAIGKPKGGPNINGCFKYDNHNTAFGYQWRREYIESLPISSAKSSRLVRCIETGKIYPSILLAAKDNNITNANHITDCCKGKQKTCGKLHWEYAD